jgi:hypothetical protein
MKRKVHRPPLIQASPISGKIKLLRNKFKIQNKVLTRLRNDPLHPRFHYREKVSAREREWKAETLSLPSLNRKCLQSTFTALLSISFKQGTKINIDTLWARKTYLSIHPPHVGFSITFVMDFPWVRVSERELLWPFTERHEDCECDVVIPPASVV